MLAKKTLENGEDCDNIPESLRQLLAMQAMESGRPFPRQLIGRPEGPMAQYGSGNMLIGDPNAQGKTGMYSTELSDFTLLICLFSHPPLHVSFPEHWYLATSGTECHGLGHFLFPR
jgi:hypothetical protein